MGIDVTSEIGRHPRSPEEALQIQRRMRSMVHISETRPEMRLVAGIDVGYDTQNNQSKGALVLMSLGDPEPLFSMVAYDRTPFPYIPGLLSFREAPVILKLLSSMKEKPDLLMIDGHGIAHPRRLGIAAHIGVLTGIPAIGVAKSVLCGTYKEPGLKKGAAEPLFHRGEKIGTAYRSRANVKPIFISPGHKTGHDSAVDVVERFLTRFRLPEPTRLADKLSKHIKS